MTSLKDILTKADALRAGIHREAMAAEKSAGDSAFREVTKGAVWPDIAITEDTIKKLHKMSREEAADSADASYRTGGKPSFDDGYTPPNPEDIPRLTGHLTDQIRSSKFTLHPVELAAMAYKRLTDIQPFENGNDETAALLMNLILVSAGYAPVTIPDGRRMEFQKALSMSRSSYDMEPFSRLIAECVLEAEEERVKRGET